MPISPLSFFRQDHFSVSKNNNQDYSAVIALPMFLTRKWSSTRSYIKDSPLWKIHTKKNDNILLLRRELLSRTVYVSFSLNMKYYCMQNHIFSYTYLTFIVMHPKLIADHCYDIEFKTPGLCRYKPIKVVTNSQNNAYWFGLCRNLELETKMQIGFCIWLWTAFPTQINSEDYYQMTPTILRNWKVKNIFLIMIFLRNRERWPLRAVLHRHYILLMQ